MKQLIPFFLSALLLPGCVKEIPSPSYKHQPPNTVGVIHGDTSICFYWLEFSLINGLREEVDSFRWIPIDTNGYYFHVHSLHDTLAIDNIEWPDTGNIILMNYVHGDSSSFNITVLSCFQSLYIPTGFKPDGDGMNDRWSPVYYGISEMDWMIRSENGKVLFDNKGDINASWDGTYEGKPQPEGLYRYWVRYTTIETHESKVMEGWLQLYRN
ncbi:MAG: hypothetical protein GC178_04225 [Flavobacteriales bacterium]|nr:hypothetical protein [Flavobacteriales bacterium]